MALEAKLREEWRVRKEDALLCPAGGFMRGFVSVDDNAEVSGKRGQSLAVATTSRREC